MQKHETQYSITKMAKVFGVSRSGYYAWKRRKTSVHERREQELKCRIQQIFAEHRGRYGSPRVWEELKARDIRVGRKRVERLMRKLFLQARLRRKRIVTTESRHRLAVSENILGRNFCCAQAGEKWVSDITYLRTAQGWLYLTVVIDLWDRKIIGWAISEDLRTEHVIRAVVMAAKNRALREGLIFHSDRGVQYCSEEFRFTLKRLCPSVRQSMSRKGNCWDNACAESFFKTLKAELLVLDGKHSAKEVQTEVFEYIEIYYNRCRRYSALNYAIPIAISSVV